MKNIYLLVCLVLTWISGLSQSSSGTLDRKVEEVENGLRAPVHFVDEPGWNITDRMSHYGVPGVSIAVISDYKIEWLKTYGVMNRDTKEPVTSTTLFQAGSISKPVASYAALTMVEDKILNLDDPVNNFLTSWQIPDNEFTQQQPVTLQHLVSHTGGLTVHGFLGYTIFEEVPTLLQVLDGKKPANSPPIFVDKLPGESFRYSGGGYCIMQQMMIDQSGTDFPALVKKRVLDPLEMNHSTYEQPLPNEKIVLAATGYLPDGSMTVGKRHVYPEMAAAGLWTTAEDLAKFTINIQESYRGEEVAGLSTEMVKKMLTPVESNFIGLGIFINPKGNDIYFGHGGWDEGFSSEMIAHRDHGYGVVVLTNSNHPDFIAELIRSVAAAYSWSGYLAPAYARKPFDIEQMNKWTGRYRFSSNQIARIFTEGEKLFIQYPRNPKEEIFDIGNQFFIRKEREKLMTFRINPDNSERYLVFVDEGQRDSIEYLYPKMAEDQKIPYEWIEESNFSEALNAYQKSVQENPGDPEFSERQINRIGYQLLENGDVEKAIDMFKVNVELYPNSFNVYDSLGEAYLEAGERNLAIENYKKSLELNPENEGGRRALKTLGVDF